jgi:hypothetical protein
MSAHQTIKKFVSPSKLSIDRMSTPFQTTKKLQCSENDKNSLSEIQKVKKMASLRTRSTTWWVAFFFFFFF